MIKSIKKWDFWNFKMKGFFTPHIVVFINKNLFSIEFTFFKWSIGVTYNNTMESIQ